MTLSLPPTRPPSHTGLTLRRFLLLLITAGSAYVAVIGLIITVRIAPTAGALQRHSSRVLVAHDEIAARLVSLGESVDRVHLLMVTARAARRPLPPDTARRLGLPIRARLDSVAALQTAEYLSGIPAEVRVALANAAQSESAVGVLLLNALAEIELGRPEAAAAPLRAADAQRRRTEALLQEAQRTALADMVEREKNLADAADFAGKAVFWWLVIGVVLTPVLVIFVRNRVHTPLQTLEAALTDVANGNLSTAIEVVRDDELGRLGRHFNTMTTVIRLRADEEERRGQDALHESEDRYRVAFENAALGMAEVAPGGAFMRVNPAMCAMLGYAEAELLSLTASDVTHEDDRAEDEWLRNRSRSGEPLSYRNEKRYRHKDGSVVWASVTAAPVRRRDGSLAYWVGIIEDTTEHRSLQRQLVESQRLESVGRLAGGVAHDFNNLLTAVIGYAELARDSLPEAHPATTSLTEIGRAADRAAALTRQLLTFARQQLVEPKVLDLNTITAGMDRLLRRLIGEDIDLVTRLDPQLGRALVDPTQFEQVVVNLVVNARDAMPQGGKLTIETRNTELSGDDIGPDTDVPPGRYVMLAVTDNGMGMNEATRQRIFEPFFTTKDRSKGTGLGLSTVYGIVKQAGGHVVVYSEPGRGATFKVYLPRTDELPDVDAAAPPPEKPVTRGSETILLVEDEPAVLALLSNGLIAQGYRVLTARDGLEALSIASTGGPIHMLVSDVVMPNLNGRELAARLEQLLPDLRILFMSGYAEDAMVHQGVVDPGVAFLSKPFTATDLAIKVRHALDSPRAP